MCAQAPERDAADSSSEATATEEEVDESWSAPSEEEETSSDDAPPRAEASWPDESQVDDAASVVDQEGLDEQDDDWLDDPELLALDDVTVIGEREEDLSSLPGAGTVISREELRATGAVNANEVLRRVPGVHVLEEDGLGLRPNIGFRGLSPDRSRNVLVLEDGVPVALAPYGEPELYYAPRIERMRRLEVVRGSGSVLYGPQTVGGVVNYVTLDPPEESTVTADARYGSFGYFLAEASAGGTHGNVGYLLYAMHHRNQGHRGFDLRLTDIMGKLRIDLTERSTVRVKLGLYDESSRTTYLGLTTPQFEADPSFNFATNDLLPVRRYSASVQHTYAFTPRVQLHTTLYGNQTSRDWRRQDFDRAPVDGRTYERIIDGGGREVSLAEGPTDRSGIYFREGNGNRNRSFTIGGLESRVRARYSLGAVESLLTGGVRLHYEQATEQRIDGSVPAVSTGRLRSDETRTGYALAAYVSNRFTLADRVRITPGVRLESLWHQREQRRDANEDLSPVARASQHTLALIPGLGISGDLLRAEGGPQLTAFGGVHRGFAPPRTKDAITPTGAPLDLDAEHSWVYELGARLSAAEWLHGELTGFLLDYRNQIIAPTEAGGAASGSEDQLVNSGRTRHVGLESALQLDPARAAGARSFRVPLALSYTYVRSRFGGGWRDDLRGNALPYAPEHLFNAIARFEHDAGVSVQVSGNYVAAQFTDRENTEAPSVDGLVGRIPARFLLDARVAYTVAPIGLTFYVLAKNLADTRFIANRAPQGIQPGMFRQIVVGLRGEI
ncbi:MAG: TonB-dependent receptor [Myxococcales bacterium]|nr:TonB-dependent receptor [Myxococcales bacterium]